MLVFVSPGSVLVTGLLNVILPPFQSGGVALDVLSLSQRRACFTRVIHDSLTASYYIARVNILAMSINGRRLTANCLAFQLHQLSGAVLFVVFLSYASTVIVGSIEMQYRYRPLGPSYPY